MTAALARIREFVPDFPDITAAALDGLASPDAGIALLRSVAAARAKIAAEEARLRAQAEGPERVQDATWADVRREFGAGTVAELEAVCAATRQAALDAAAALAAEIAPAAGGEDCG